MESDIKYVLVVTYGGHPNIVNHSNQLEKMHRWLVQEKQDCPAFHILSAQRYVICATGKVVATDVRIDFDEGGLRIYDKYGTLIDSCHLPETEPVKKKFRVRREETWSDDIVVEAESEEDAVSIVEQMVENGGFDVLEGGLTDVQTYVVEGEF